MCGEKYHINEVVYSCRKCGDILEIKYDHDLLMEKIQKSNWKSLPLSVWRYKDFMPIHDSSKIISLGEGGTGLHQCCNLGKSIGINSLYIKNEGENPTGSFKDRGMTVGVSKAAELGMRIVACASTGNTSASLAA
ncbi:MAG: pyridoxal-phosphate dependent enzyme, partial [Candidatus Bathyarchaeia archaeon]